MKRLNAAMAKARPDFFVASMSVEQRRGRIYVDHNQDLPARNTVAPYSLRARAGATVSTPIGWDEVDAVRDGSLDPAALRFTTDDVLARVEEYGDLFDVAGATRAALPGV